MTLTTPVPRDFDAVFPGENWFFYWKTSASLWKDKLASMPGNSRIVVPINWSFHSDTGDSCDFAETKPETDLKKLALVAKELGHEVIFLLPLSPVPYLPNGGVPHLLARSFSLDKEGLGYGIVDAEGKVNKTFSFFDSRIYQAFDKFVKGLGEYFSREGIASDIWGMESGYLNEGIFYSYFIDRSKTFEQGFSKFLNVKKEQGIFQGQFESLDHENIFRDEFHQTIKDLYIESAEQALSGNWEGIAKVAFLGGSNQDFFERLSYGAGQTSFYSGEVFRSLCQDAFPSSVLLPAKAKKGILGRQLEEVITNSYLPLKFSSECYDEEDSFLFAPLRFFYICSLDEQPHFWGQVGLLKYLEDRFSWCYQMRLLSSFKWDESEAVKSRVYFIQGEDLIHESFQTMLKFFMSGGRIVLNRSGMNKELLKKLESFYIENSLVVEKINLQTEMTHVSLGEGRLLLFDGDRLLEGRFEENLQLWHRLVTTFDLVHQVVEETEGVNFFWRTRSSTHNELNYEEVRRLSLYNPTSYKKKMTIRVSKNFALMKVMDQYHVDVKSQPGLVDIEVLPEGSVSLDFGVFSNDRK